MMSRLDWKTGPSTLGRFMSMMPVLHEAYRERRRTEFEGRSREESLSPVSARSRSRRLVAGRPIISHPHSSQACLQGRNLSRQLCVSE
jgi:hypothetical protein